MSLSMRPGQSYRICQFSAQMDSVYRQKLMSMGLMPGAIFQVRRIAPLGDPIQLDILGYSLSLRLRDLNLLQLEEVVA